MRTLESRDPLMKYLSSTGLNWIQVTVSRNNNEEKRKMVSFQLVIKYHLNNLHGDCGFIIFSEW